MAINPSESFTRGTTPTLTVNLGLPVSNIKALHLSFAQRGDIVLLKTLNDCTVVGDALEVTLTQEETLKFLAGECSVQGRILLNGIGEKAAATGIIKVKVLDVQENGVITEEGGAIE